ncbi:MAG: VCBS repeat-containing protein [Bacteroidota bacterium]
MRNLVFLLGCVLLVNACTPDASAPQATTSSASFDDQNLFERLPSDQTQITFNNQVTENLELNTFTNDGIVQGAGVGVLDVNKDGLPDVFFAGNMVSDQLYLNEGDFRFQNISQTAGFAQESTWSTGVAIVDINNDGYDDIYVCKFIYADPARRRNKLYLNNQDNTFTEKAVEYGIADEGYSIMANFFDYDGDGDLDLYVANQPPAATQLRKNIKPSDTQYTDRLYRNDGQRFTDVTVAAGVQNNCFSLSATASDFNDDGYPDLYVASDYDEPDLFYQNNGDGTFTNVANEALQHISNFSMGADVADINNDGYMDLFTADMVAEDNFRNKTNMSSMAVEKFWGLVKMGYHYQFMFNSLQLNNGNGTFSEIAQMSGVSKTDWSWSALFVDADQDGYKDLFVTNGILKEIRNKDYRNQLKKLVADRKAQAGGNTKFDPLELSGMAPSVKIKNRAFRNTGDLVFESKTDAWGFEKPGWSQGMAYADFDQDGDLDFVINNTNEAADIYRNRVNERGGQNFLSVTATGMPQNGSGVNARVWIEYGEGSQQVSDLTPYRGYMSTSQNVAHFGLGQQAEVARVRVVFPDGKEWRQEGVAANQKLVATYRTDLPTAEVERTPATYFQSLTTAEMAINYEENPFDDYDREVLIPYKMSNLGPILAVADVNQDGNDDFYLGGAVGVPGKLYVQDAEGRFTYSPQNVFEGDKPYEDGAAQFVDVDLDGDMDLYVATGGNEYPQNTNGYQDRLYINAGDGNFLKTTAVPEMTTSTGAVCPLDYDNDGDLDFFVGGRQLPGAYGRRVSSFLLENTQSSLVDVTASKTEGFTDLGMVTDAKWVDLDGDEQAELVVVGEWMPVRIFKLREGRLVPTENPSLETSNGLWNSLETLDVDGDGDLDLIAGNYGLNYKYTASVSNPFTLYVKDFDENGTNDVYLGYHDQADGKLYPVRGRQCSSEQMPFVKEKFKNYDAFGKATLVDVLEGRLDGSTVQECYTFAHTVFLNDGKGSFKTRELPKLAQIAPIYDMVVRDFDGDGQLDLFCVGNFHQREVETTRSDAGVGALLLGDGAGGFTAVSPSVTGVVAKEDARAVVWLNNKGQRPVMAIANNGAPMQFYVEAAQ